MRLLWARRVAEGGPKNGAPGGASISRLVNRALERFFGIRLQDLQSDDQWKPRTGIPKDAQDQTEANNPPPPP